jgi:hypothetical protein
LNLTFASIFRLISAAVISSFVAVGVFQCLALISLWTSTGDFGDLSEYLLPQSIKFMALIYIIALISALSCHLVLRVVRKASYVNHLLIGLVIGGLLGSWFGAICAAATASVFFFIAANPSALDQRSSTGNDLA